MVGIITGRGPRYTQTLRRARAAWAPWQERLHSAAGRGGMRPNSKKTAAAHSMSVTGLGFANELPLPVWSIIRAYVDEGRAGAERTQRGGGGGGMTPPVHCCRKRALPLALSSNPLPPQAAVPIGLSPPRAPLCDIKSISGCFTGPRTVTRLSFTA